MNRWAKSSPWTYTNHNTQKKQVFIFYNFNGLFLSLYIVYYVYNIIYKANMYIEVKYFCIKNICIVYKIVGIL